MLKKLETKKNLLLFFPYNVTFDTVHTYDEAVSSIVTGIENDFNVSFEYRKFYAPNYDTFFTCIYDDSFLLFKITNNKLVLCDNVKSQEIQTFYYLMDLYTDCYD